MNSNIKDDNKEPRSNEASSNPDTTGETTPLVSIPSKTVVAGITIPSAEEIKSSAATSLKSLAESAIKAKNSMKKSPWIVSIVVGIASFFVIASGFLGLITYVVRLHPVTAIIKVYQILFGTLCLIVEGSRYYNPFNMKGLIRQWVSIFELNIGRGLLHILTAGLTLASDWTIGEAVPGIVLGICGIFNVIWGVKTAMKVKRLFENLKAELRNVTTETDGSTGILMIQKKFTALDLNGDGKLSKEELEIGCKTLNLDLDDGDLNMVFSVLDPKNKGYIGIDDFEQWWYSEKDPLKYIV